MMFHTLLCVLTMLLSQPDAVRCTKADSLVFESKMQILVPQAELPVPELVVKTALTFLGTPYVAGTLESEPEQLTVNLRQTDCILFVEMCLGLALTAKSEDRSFQHYCDILRNLRYRNGVVDGYASRLHYTSEWIQQASSNGIMEEITALYGSQFEQKINFMSTHSDKYPRMAGNPEAVAAIREYEQAVESAADYHYISQEQIYAIAGKIKDGDIICFKANIQGLDVTHVAIAYHQEGELHFIHASSSAGKVIIEPRTLAHYAKNGIRLVRLK